jgi:hypothetical protein
VKMQFALGETPVVMSGVVKGMTYDQKKNRSLLHIQATPPSTATSNRILTYVFNLVGEREAPGRQADIRAPSAPAVDPTIPVAEPAEEEPAVDLD